MQHADIKQETPTAGRGRIIKNNIGDRNESRNSFK